MPIGDYAGPTASEFDMEWYLANLTAYKTVGVAPLGPIAGMHRSEFAAGMAQEVDTVALGVGPMCTDYDPELSVALGIDLG